MLKEMIKSSTDGGVLAIQYPNEQLRYFNKDKDLYELYKITNIPTRKIEEYILNSLELESYSSIKFEIERNGKNTNEIEKLKQKYNLQDVSFLNEFVKARVFNTRNFHAINVYGKYKEEFARDICYLAMDSETAALSSYMKKYLKLKFIWLILVGKKSNFKRIRILDSYYQIPNIVILDKKPSPYCQNIEVNTCVEEITINKANLWYEALA